MCKPEIGAGAKHRCRGELLAVCFVLLSRGPGENVACRAEAERLAAGRGLDQRAWTWFGVMGNHWAMKGRVSGLSGSSVGHSGNGSHPHTYWNILSLSL